MKDQNINPYTASGGKWLTEFIADYVYGFIYDFAAPQFVYEPMYSRNYVVNVFLIDDRTLEEMKATPLKTLINVSVIRSALIDLIPYSNITVNVFFKNSSSYPKLKNILLRSTANVDSWIHWYLFLEPTNITYIDAQPVYSYLKNNLHVFTDVERSMDRYVIPVFAFALSNDAHFVFKYKWLILKPDPEYRSILGAALRDLAIVGMSQKDFQRGDHVKPLRKVRV